MKKTFLFAGASSAMAKATAGQLMQSGNEVIGLTTKSEEYDYSKILHVKSYDFGNFPALENKLDGIVYFPGTINLKPFHRLTANEFNTDLTINALGAVAFVQAYLSNLKKSESSSIVFISSVAASTGMPFHSSIAMAKGAIEGLTKALAAELTPAVRVNCLAPSLVDTPLGERFLNTTEKTEQMKKRNPMQKIGSVTDMANAVSFFLGPQSAWITGQTIAIDGGMGTIKNS